MPILNWLNKDQAVTTAKNCDYRLLEEVPSLSYGDTNSENLLIQGDNLEALKALIPFYAGKVKCIFIDPPYNTKSAFEHYDDNLEHSKWLSLMYPRLELLRELLAIDGVLLVQIDYRESAYLKLMLDEIFGRNSFKNEIIVGRGTKNVQSQFETIDSLASGHDTVYLYSKTHNHRLPKLQAISDENSPGKWDTFWRGTDRQTMRYPLFDIIPDRGQWRWSKERAYRARDNFIEYELNHKKKHSLDDYYLLNLKKNEIDLDFVKMGEDKVQYYVSPRNYKLMSDLWLDVKTIGRVTDFPHEKHEELLQRVIEWNTTEGEIVLDSFLGSASTAAVAHKMKRRYIGVEIGEHAQTHCQPRLKKVVDGEEGGISKAVDWKGGGGFKFVRLGQTVFDEYGCLNKDIKFSTLAAHVWYLETKQPMAKKKRSAYLGVHGENAYYLLYNGILGDRRPDGGNVLTSKVIKALPSFNEQRKHNRTIVIYGESTRLGEARLRQENIVFKQIPYDVGAL